MEDLELTVKADKCLSRRHIDLPLSAWVITALHICYDLVVDSSECELLQCGDFVPKSAGLGFPDLSITYIRVDDTIRTIAIIMIVFGAPALLDDRREKAVR